MPITPELKKYCISAIKDEVSLNFIIPLTQEQYDFFIDSPSLQFAIGDALVLCINRREVDEFSIQPMQ